MELVITWLRVNLESTCDQNKVTSATTCLLQFSHLTVLKLPRLVGSTCKLVRDSSSSVTPVITKLFTPCSEADFPCALWLTHEVVFNQCALTCNVRVSVAMNEPIQLETPGRI